MIDPRNVDEFNFEYPQNVHFYKFESLLPLIRKYEALVKMDKCSFANMIIKPFNTPVVEPS